MSGEMKTIENQVQTELKKATILRVQNMKANGYTNEEIARVMNFSEKFVRSLLGEK